MFATVSSTLLRPKLFGMNCAVRTGYATSTFEISPEFLFEQEPHRTWRPLAPGDPGGIDAAVLATREQWHQGGLLTRYEMQTNPATHCRQDLVRDPEERVGSVCSARGQSP